MRIRSLVAVASVACISAVGCDVLTGVGNLSFNGNPGAPDANESDGGGTPASEGGAQPVGTRLATSTTLALEGMTSDGYVAYGDVNNGALSALGIEQPDGGPPSSSSPLALGTADLLTTTVDGRLVEFFSASSESDAGPSQVGTLYVWSSSMSAATKIASGALEPDPTNGYVTVAASADGQYVAYLGNVDPSGATAALIVANTQTGSTKTLVGSIDVLEDACEPRIYMSGAYVVAAYCQVPAGGQVSSGLPDGGTNYYLATISSFLASTGAPTTLASNVRTGFAADPGGVAAIMLAKNGLVATALSGDAGLLSIDPSGTGGVLSNDGKTVLYATTSSALKRARTSAPASPTTLVTSSFNFVNALSDDGNWALGGVTMGSQSGTSDWYAASAVQAGSATALSSDTTSEVRGSYFTTDSKYALYVTGVDSNGAGAMTAYALGGGKAPIALGGGSTWAVGATGSQIVYNVNSSGYQGDLQVVDLAKGSTPALIAAQANSFFVLGPALDKVVYVLTDSISGGLWVADLGAICSGSPVAYHPPAGSSGSCTSQEVSTFDTGCVQATTVSRSCGEVQGISGSCLDCLVSDGTAQQWGVVNSVALAGGISQLNPGGCFARMGSSASNACAAALQADRECDNDTCASQSDLTSLETCSANAESATCSCYSTKATTACAGFTSSPCHPDNYASFEDGFLKIAKGMCE